ncbi:MAG TPA: hypothetical protein VFG25_06105 [Nitrosopumilaceae archaeon]|nr:hypothetical protein [Nitrosopumilaceae archaeon]
MAAKGIVYVVFIFPIIISTIFGTFVLNGILIEEPDRELNMWRFDSTLISTPDVEILGLENQYSTSEPIKVQVAIFDKQFDCGDLYITIYGIGATSKQVIAQNGFFKQCFAKNNAALPVGDQFSEIIDKPGNYEIVIQMVDEDGKNNISSSKKFTVK